MGERFVKYLHLKGITQRKLAELSCVSPSLISRFCSGGNIQSDKLLKIIQCCDDLSLDWLFYDTGDMIRRRGDTINLGVFAGADVNDSVVVHDSKNVHVNGKPEKGTAELLAEKDRLIAIKDRTITERDATIERLHSLLLAGK